MIGKKVSKIILILMCILVLIMPYTSTVLAVALTQDDTTAELQIQRMHQGGEESSGTLTEDQEQFYDTKPHGYTVGETKVYKIIVKDDYEYSNMFYCLNAEKQFPGVTNVGQDSLQYSKVADLKDPTNANVKALHLSAEYSQDESKWTSNYRALMWLVDNMYLSKQSPEQKDDYLTKAFAGYDGDLETVKAFLTDDDIDVVQQYAIWYFTNNDTSKYNVEQLPAVRLTTLEKPNQDDLGYEERQQMADYLFKYLVNSAKAGVNNNVTYPTMGETVQGNPIEREGYYVVGPFKVNKGTATPTEYSIKLLDQNNSEISKQDYKIYIEGEEDFTNKNIDEIFDQQYYIYLPESNKTITNVTLEISYASYETEASLWIKTGGEEGDVYQPVTLLTREKTPHKVDKGYPVEDRPEADLALRKYIVKVNNETVNRQPVVDVTGLKEGTSETAEYKHAKDPVKVSIGDKVVYEIRVYNESDVDAEGTVIVDALPKGLEYDEESEINRTYGWQLVTEGEKRNVYLSNYLSDHLIQKFDKENDETLHSDYVQIECKIADDALVSSVLTNVAEIKEDGVDDRDSIPGNNDYVENDYDASDYKGDNTNNSKDLSDEDYYYKGREDDDDFEKVEVKGKPFDLSLKKFITRVNKTAPNPSREPKVDVTNLKNGGTDATYTTRKTPVVVEKGDIVTYTIRVYNEGELDGYAEEVADYIPQGLGFLVDYTTNLDNYWLISEDAETVKLSTIEGGKNNLSVDDFNGIKNLDEVDVVVGPTKITSTKLKSSEVDNKNLLKGFDKKTGEELDYKDIQITCIVLADTITNSNFRNIAEVTKDSDENKKDITDIDSEPDSVDPDKYPGDNQDQDDDDYEDLTTEPKEFDLSLKKFISKVEDQDITDREPSVVVDSEGNIQFSAKAGAKDPLKVENGNIITYTIRVYNEGNISGYAKEVSDNLPKGLEFLLDNEINKKYDWKLYDSNGNETTDLKQAVKVKTDYLSKEKSEARNEDNLLKAFDANAEISNDPENANPDYRDLQIAFKVVESEVDNQERIIKNIAEITDDEDENGNPVEDVDSTPGNDKENEDDIDDENVYVKYFDLNLQKDLVKIIVTENGATREISVSSTDGLQKVEVHRKRIDSTIIKFVYNITITNEGEIAGYADEITDYIPEGLEFLPEENKQWTQVSSNVVTTNALSNTRLEPGQSASVQIVLKWINGENNFGTKINVAEISDDRNDSDTPDIDSTPNNRVLDEDDIDNAPVVVTISTGTVPTYITLTTTVLVIMATGIILIKKYVL